MKIFNLFKVNKSNIFQSKDPQVKLVAGRSKIPFYRKLTTELITNTHDDDLDKLIAYNIFAILQENKRRGDICVNPKLSDGQKAFYITRIVEGEIRNGGISQLFFNCPDLKLPKLSLQAFDRINAKEFSSIVFDAINLYIEHGKEHSKDSRTLENLSQSYDNDVFDSLDKRFYEINRSGDLKYDGTLNELRLRFVKDNITEFI